MTPMETRQMKRLRRSMTELGQRYDDTNEYALQIEGESWPEGWREILQEIHLMQGCLFIMESLVKNTIAELPADRVYPPDEYRNV